MNAGVILELVLTQECFRTRRLLVSVISEDDQDRTNSALCKGTAVNQSVAEGAQSCAPID